LTANTENWGVFYSQVVKDQLAGTWKPEQTLWGIKENLVVLSPLNLSVPADVAKLFNEKKQEIVDGKLIPFAGPLKDNTGAVKVAAGSTMPVGDLMGINWLVEGVKKSVDMPRRCGMSIARSRFNFINSPAAWLHHTLVEVR